MVNVAGASKSDGSDFRYRFDAHRTFSRRGKRPETSPAWIAVRSRISSRSTSTA